MCKMFLLRCLFSNTKAIHTHENKQRENCTAFLANYFPLASLALLAGAVEKKNVPHSFCTVLIYVMAVFAIYQTLLPRAQLWLWPGPAWERLRYQGAKTSAGASRLPCFDWVNGIRPFERFPPLISELPSPVFHLAVKLTCFEASIGRQTAQQTLR